MVELTIEQLMYLLNTAIKEGAQGAPEYTHMDVSIAVTKIKMESNKDGVKPEYR